MKTLKYTHPSLNKYDVNMTYLYDDLIKEMSEDMIRILFTPIDFEWEEKKEVSKKSIDKVSE